MLSALTRREAAAHPRVVIVGAGFGGLSAAKELGGTAFEVTLIDQHNYHLFQPLLYQVATAGLAPSDIAAPIRGILSHTRNVSVMLAQVSGIDVAGRAVIAEGRRIPFDYLILATGAQHAYFGHDHWASFAPGLKTLDDATYLRRRILLAFEKAETEPDATERRRLLNFVVVGGGRKRAVADLGGLKVKGFLAWMLWSLAHIYFLIGFRSRLIVAMNWAWNYVTFQRGTRLITGLSGSRVENMPRPQQSSPAPEAVRNVA
ncbi:MAG: FAD-dependent oxidoreductase [Methyloceanibacter sp.]